MTGKERRKSPRFQVWLPVHLVVGSERLEGHIHDISMESAFVEAERTWPLDTELEITMPLPDAAESMELVGRVVRIGTRGDTTQGMALRFTHVSPGAKAWLSQLLGAHG
jgi:Tfp pilus assembly protein PilZ